MKKVVVSIIAVIILLIANVVYADYGIPGGVEYEAVITNEDGAEVDEDYGSLSVIPSGATVIVQYEYDGEAYVKYNDEGYLIDLDDIEPVSDAEELAEKYENNKKDMYVWREGAYLYKGPSILYGKLDEEIEIPVGTVVTIEDCSSVWGYVEYEEYSGWVYIYTSDEVSPYDMECALTEIAYERTSHYYTIDEISLSSTLDGENVVGTIPAGEHIDSYFYSAYPDPHGTTVYVVYEDIEGWYTVDETEVYQDLTDVDIDVLVTDKTEIYENLDEEATITYEISDESIGTIPENTFCEVMYRYLGRISTAYYVEYDGVQGWIYENTAMIDDSIWIDPSCPTVLGEDVEIIEYPSLEKTGETIKAGTMIEDKFCVYDSENEIYYYYIATLDGEISGWIVTSEDTFTYGSEYYYDYDYLSENYVDISEFIEEEATEDVDLNFKENYAFVNDVDPEYIDGDVIEDYFLYCVVGSAVALVVAVVLLVIANNCSNKKKNKKEE